MAQSHSAGSCSEISASLKEPLAGTAPHCWGFLLVEHNGPWPPDGLTALGDDAERVSIAAENSSLRPGLMRRFDRERTTTMGHTVLISVPDEGGVLISRRFDTLAEIDVFDIEDATEMARDGEIPDGWKAAQPVVAVCTHAKRDACCATEGRALASAIHDIDPEILWETTHLGGHRFAATAAALPAGVVYGRLQAAEAGALVEAVRSGTLLVDRMRGRTNLSSAAQAAEVEVRKQSGANRDGAVVMLDEVESQLAHGTRNVTEWEVDGVAWTVVIDVIAGAEAGLEPRRFSCAKPGLDTPDVFSVVSVHTGGTNRTAGQWDERHRGAHPTPPDATVLHEVSQLASGTALDIASGTGRHALMLAREGWSVTALDFSHEAITVLTEEAAAQNLQVNAVVADATAWEPPGGTRYDLILMAFVHLPEVFSKALRWLAPGGRLVLVGHSVRNLVEGVGGPSDPRLLHDPIELAARATGARLRVLRVGEVERETTEGRAIDAVFVATNPAVVLNPATAEAAHSALE